MNPEIMKVGLTWLQFNVSLGRFTVVFLEVQQTMKTASSDEELAFKQKQKDMATYTKKVRNQLRHCVGWFVDGFHLTSMLVKSTGIVFGVLACLYVTCLYSCKSCCTWANANEWKSMEINSYKFNGRLLSSPSWSERLDFVRAVRHPSVNPTYSLRLWGHDTPSYFWRVGWNLMIQMRCQ